VRMTTCPAFSQSGSRREHARLRLRERRLFHVERVPRRERSEGREAMVVPRETSLRWKGTEGRSPGTGYGDADSGHSGESLRRKERISTEDHPLHASDAHRLRGDGRDGLGPA
jgi:hypothetical protein